MISVSRMKALKRHRKSWLPHDNDPGYGTYFALETLPPGPHAPAKAEAKLLRRICSQTGLSEEAVRAHRSYRQKLAAAAKPQPGRHPAFGAARRIRKAVTASTGLGPHHADFLAAFEPRWTVHVENALHSRGYRILSPVSSAEALAISLTKPRSQ